MKLLRIALGITLLLAILAGVAALAVYRNQDRLVKLMLARVDAASGLHISIASSRLEFRSHLVVLLEEPHIFRDGLEVAHLTRVRAWVSYHNLIYRQGLPLRTLFVEAPVVTLPADALAGGPGAIPRLDAEFRNSVAAAFAALSGVTRRVQIDNASFNLAGAGPLADSVNLNAYHRRAHSERWYIHIDGRWRSGLAAGVRMGGAVAFGRDRRLPADVILHGDLRGGEEAVRTVPLGTTLIDERSTARLRFALHQDGRLSGAVSALVRRVTLHGQRLAAPLALGDFALHFPFEAGSARLEVPSLTLAHDQTKIDASLRLDDPYGADPVLTVGIRGLHADLQALRKLADSFRGLPKTLVAIEVALQSGQLAIDQAQASAPLSAFRGASASVLRENFTAAGALNNLAVRLPSQWGMPELSSLNAKLSYAQGQLSLSAGSAQFGNSRIESLSARAELEGRRAERVAYVLEARGELAADEVYSAALTIAGNALKPVRDYVASVRGQASLNLKLAGTLSLTNPAAPATMVARLQPHPLQIAFKDLPAPLEFTAGAITVVPTTLSLDRVTVRAAGDGQGAAGGGSVTVNGVAQRAPQGVIARHVTVELHGLSAERWLPLLVEPSDLALQGRINGAVFIDGVPGATPNYRITGRLTQGKGEMQFGFLRAPVLLSSATLTLDGKGMKIEMPKATLEKSPLDLTMSIRDFAHPEMELNAIAQRLDLMVMKFIRLPWQPPTPVMMFKIPVTGYIGARRASLARLEMAEVGGNYRYDHGNWWVHGFKADALGGQIGLVLSGRQKDDWIHMRGDLKQIDGAALMQLIQGSGPPKMTGKMDLSGDFWADTNNDFFTTVAGKMSINAEHGILAKFRLLSRILGMIDLKSWLTANVPDPRVAGLPYDTLSATFAGNAGVFYTKDLTLKGPVMDLGARGSINTGAGTMDMTIAMVPFHTVNWLVTKIPLVGERLAEGTTLFAGYFHVSGPMADPSVTPEPITSVAELVKKTLGMPLNIIRPNTIR